MKFIHLGDLHIGKSVNEFSMIEDQRYILQQILKIVEDEAIDGVLMAGDIYDKTIPSEEAVKVFDWFLNELVKRKTKTFIVSGNHDSDERLNFGSNMFRSSDIYIAGKYEGQIQKVTLEDEQGPLNVWMIPYIKASRVGHFYPDKDTSSYDAAFRTVLEAADIDEGQRNVVMVHQFVTGRSKEVETAGSETRALNVGNVERIRSDCFDIFDYVAMGHIHKAQSVGRETCRYSGSPLKYSVDLNEINSVKSVPVVELKEKGQVDVQLIELKPRRDIRHIKGNLEDLIKSAEGKDDYIYATLTDEETQFDALARLREVYPNVMKLDYDNSSTRAMDQFQGDIQVEGKDFHEMMGDFYSMILGTEPDDEDWKLIEEVAREAGVIE